MNNELSERELDLVIGGLHVPEPKPPIIVIIPPNEPTFPVPTKPRLRVFR